MIRVCYLAISYFKAQILFYSGMVRPADQETVAIKKIFFSLTVPRRRGHAIPHRGHMEKHPGWSGGRRIKGKM